MTRNAVFGFVTDLVKFWDARRALCLARLVYALMRGGRLGVAEIAPRVLRRGRPCHHPLHHHIRPRHTSQKAQAPVVPGYKHLV